jgi:hypothetical protein
VDELAARESNSAHFNVVAASLRETVGCALPVDICTITEQEFYSPPSNYVTERRTHRLHFTVLGIYT